MQRDATQIQELRRSLAIIREFVTLVRDGVAGPVTPEQHRCLDPVLRNAERLLARSGRPADARGVETDAAPRVLVVDDDPQALELMVDVLGGSPLELRIETATSAYEACVRFGAAAPDLVVLDLHLPGGDSRRTLASMRDERPETRFLAVSGDPERFEAVRRLGCSACLSKPFHTRQLLELVGRLVAPPGAARPDLAVG